MVAPASHPAQMTISRAWDRACQNPGAKSKLGFAVMALGYLTVIPLAVDYLMTKRARTQGPLFSSEGWEPQPKLSERRAEMAKPGGAGRLVRPEGTEPDPVISAEEFVTSGPGTRDRKHGASAPVASMIPKSIQTRTVLPVPMPAPDAVQGLADLLGQGKSYRHLQSTLTTAVRSGDWPRVVTLLRDGTPQKLFAQAMAAVQAGAALTTMHRFAENTRWRSEGATAHCIEEAYCGEAQTAFLMGSTFPHAEGAEMRFQDGLYLGKHGAVVTDGQGGKSHTDRDAIRAVQIAVGTLGTALLDQASALPRPVPFLKQHHKALAQLINAAAHSANPAPKEAQSGACATFLGDFGKRGQCAFGVGDCGVAAGFDKANGEGHVETFIPEQVNADKQHNYKSMGVDVLDDSVIQFFEFSPGARRFFLFSDGVPGLLNLAPSRSVDGKSEVPEARKPDVSWGVLMAADVTQGPRHVAGLLRQEADKLGPGDSDLIQQQFRSEDPGHDRIYLAYLNMAANQARAADGKSDKADVLATTPVETRQRAAAAALRKHQKSEVTMEDQETLDKLRDSIEKRHASNSDPSEIPAGFWGRLEEIAKQLAPTATTADWDDVLKSLELPSFEDQRKDPAAKDKVRRIVRQDVIDYINARVSVTYTARAIKVIAAAAEISEAQVALSKEAVRAEFRLKPLQARLMGRDDVTFASREAARD